MKTILRAAAVFLLPLLCSPLSEITEPPPAASHPVTAAPMSSAAPTASATATPTSVEPPHFSSDFNTDLLLEETGRMEESASPDWWVNSGAWFVQRCGVGSTWIGETPADSKWRGLYTLSNPQDTDRGAHPQNLFRLITRSEWGDSAQQVYFRILADNLSASANRDRSNGVLLFHRYRDAQNLYYAGARVDGSAVIKKKTGGVYATLAEAPLFPGSYDRTGAPDLIPHGVWIGLRTVLYTEGDRVTILLYTDPDRSGFWVLALQAEDTVDPAGPLARAGGAGIRTDFMDVEFDDYRIEELSSG
jgi:hypothetical protein